MKSRRGSKGHSKAPAFDPIEELDEEIDLIEENGLSDDAFDEDFDPDEDVNAKSATMKATGEKKRGRPKKTSKNNRNRQLPPAKSANTTRKRTGLPQNKQQKEL